MASTLKKLQTHANKQIQPKRVNNDNDYDPNYSSGNIVPIHIDLIEPNEKNIRKTDIDSDAFKSLVSNLKEIGLQQNLVVYKINTDGTEKYKLLSGHRRLAALKLLHGKYPEEKRYELIPCMIDKVNADQEHDISFDLAEKMHIVSTNVEIENLTRKQLIESLNICLDYYSKKYSDKENAKKDIINETSNALNITGRQIYYLKKIEDNLIQPFYKAFIEDETLSISMAKEIIKLTQKEQYELYGMYEEKLNLLTIKDIKQYNEQIIEREEERNNFLFEERAQIQKQEISKNKNDKNSIDREESDHNISNEDDITIVMNNSNNISDNADVEGKYTKTILTDGSGDFILENRHMFIKPREKTRRKEYPINVGKDLSSIISSVLTNYFKSLNDMSDENLGRDFEESKIELIVPLNPAISYTKYLDYCKSLNIIIKQLEKIREIV